MIRRLVPLVAVLLAACAPQAMSVPPPRTVVTLGDSVPAGSACGCPAFPELYAKSQDATDVNLASPGSTSTDARTTVPASREVLSAAAEVVIMTGANDIAPAFDDPSQYPAVTAAVRDNVSAAVSAIEQIRPIPVIVLGYWNVVLDGKVGAAEYDPDEVQDAQAATAEINKALRAAAAASGATYVSTEEAFHGDDGTHDPTDLLAPDGDHPNAAGHEAIAALIPPLPAAAPAP